MRFTLLLFFLLTSGFLEAQTCVTQTDAHGKIAKSETTAITVDSTLNSFKFTTLKTDSSLSIGFAMITPSVIDNLNTNNLTLVITFNNGQSRTYNAATGSQAAAIPGGMVIIFASPITQEDLAYFQGQGINQFLVTFNDLAFTIPVSQLNASQIITGLSCITN